MEPDLNGVLEELCRRTQAIGAVLCDDEGETVCAALGPAPVSAAAEQQAREHIPKSLELTMPVAEFLIRLAGAESCGLVRTVEDVVRRHLSRPLERLHLRYRDLDLLIEPLPEAFYLLVALRRPLLLSVLQEHVREARDSLAAQLG